MAWSGAAAWVVAFAAIGIVAGAVAGPAWGWGILASGLGALLVHHLTHLQRLAAWVRAPIGTPVPYGAGIWGEVFSALHRRSGTASDRHAQLAAALARFTDAAQAMPDGVVILTAENEIAWVNRAAEVHFGLDSRRDIGAPITNLVRDPEFVSYLAAREYAEPLLLRGLRAPDQSVSAQAVPFGAEQKLILSRDVTHFERLDNVRRDFVANVSHELKTPLTAVVGFIETLRDDRHSLTPDDTERFLALASEQALRMQRLVEDLLTLSRLETAAAPAIEEEVDVSALLAEVIRDAQALSAGRHSISLEAGAPARLLGSHSELRSAFVNLATNAVRYTPAGGRIAIRWQTGRDGSGAFSVEDNGIGIDAGHIPRLTERFYRVDRGRSRESGGTGLGLAIVKHVLTRHDARLEIESAPGRGSAFTARFPATRVLAQAPRSGVQPRS